MKAELTYERAKFLADVVVGVLRPGCMRIEIAGSIRRKKAVIGDIELVVIPRLEYGYDLLNEPYVTGSLLDQVVSDNYRIILGDEKYKKIDVGQGIACDLFIQPDPATWGVNMMIRTGSADFSKWMVTSRQLGGAMPSFMRFQGARLWDSERVLETPEEEDVFAAMGLRWIEPEERAQAPWGQVGFYLKR